MQKAVLGESCAFMDESEFIQDEVTIASVRKFKTCLNLIDALTGICKYRGGLSKNLEFQTPRAAKPRSPRQQSRFIRVVHRAQ